jgi:acyl carrier protein
MQTLKRADFLLLIDKHLAEPPGTVQGPEVLADLPVWDSLAAIGFVAMLDERLGITLPSGKMQACHTVADLVALAGSQVQA